MKSRFRHPLTLLVLAALVIALTLGAYGLFLYMTPKGAQSRPLATVSENDVTVDIAFERDAAGKAWLVGTFTPLLEHFHLYSKDLPKEGRNGLGQPTRLEIASGPIRAGGDLTANQPLEYKYER